MAKSKVQQAKEDQGWRKKAPCCNNCRAFSCDIIEKQTDFGIYKKTKNKRCGIGGFATGLSNWCKQHRWKD